MELQNFIYKRKTYKISSGKKVDSIGDFYEKEKMVYIDKNVPKKFHKGIAVHEIEERGFLKKGHSYGWSHNQAQKIELDFYKKKVGAEKGSSMLKYEEALVLKIFAKYLDEDIKKLRESLFIEYNSSFKEIPTQLQTPGLNLNLTEINKQIKDSLGINLKTDRAD